MAQVIGRKPIFRFGVSIGPVASENFGGGCKRKELRNGGKGGGRTNGFKERSPLHV